MTLRELESGLASLRAEGATDLTPVKFAIGYGVEAELLSLYYAPPSGVNGPEIWFDVEAS
jgi:hypothetical protein